MVTPEEVSYAYKLFLGREPESADVIAGYCQNINSLDQLSRTFISSPEFMRRMKEMSASGGGGFMGMADFPDHYDVVVNGNHPLAGKILKAEEPADREQLVLQAKDLALLQQGLLTGERLTAFVSRSLDRLV